MIRLVTQFDSVETHPSLATPTCGCGCCSSCCCCCLASAIGASSLSAIHVSAIQRDLPPVERRGGASVIAFFALPICLGVAFVTAGYGLLVAPVLWGVLVWIAYRRARYGSPVLAGVTTAFLGSLAIVLEFFLALALLDALDAYLVASIVVGLLVAGLGYAAMRTP